MMYSATEDWDGDCLDTFMKQFLPFAKISPEAFAVCYTETADVKVDLAMVSALKALMNIPVVLPKLQWLGGDEAARVLFEQLTEVENAVMVPAMAHAQTLQNKVIRAQAKLEKMLATDEVSEDHSKFVSFFTMKSMGTMKSARGIVKKAVAEYAETPGTDEQVMADAVGAMNKAKLQTIKWGLLTFLFNPDIESLASAGKQVRHDFRAAWQLNQDTEGVKDMLGKELVDQITQVQVVFYFDF